jgi:two-component system, OmpR family, phosphate regulon sensor histidine kinase PhoR
LSGKVGFVIVNAVIVAFDLKLLLFVLLALLAGGVYLAVYLDRRRWRDPLLHQSGWSPAAWRAALDAAPFGLALFDGRHDPLYANQAARRLLETADNDPPAFLPQLRADLAALRQSAAPSSHYRTLNLPTEPSLSWWICAAPNLSLVFLTDLSRQRNLEKASQLFLGSLSHELRTPLTAVIAHLDLLNNPDLEESARQHSVSLMQKEARRLARLVQNMLELGRLETAVELNLRPLDLSLLVEEAVADLILGAEARQIAISLQIEPRLPFILGDADRLKQVVVNILDNSLKYGRPGDRVDLSLRRSPAGVVVAVVDSGPGIPADHLPCVTDRFYRARSDVGGSGLGLTIAAEILRLHGSRLEISSEGEGMGTAVRFMLGSKV